ncbi:MAG: 50S ribosomal protein L4 [Pyrinomonadaceae bacterium]
MPTVKVRNLKHEEIGDVELSDAVFGAELNESLIHAAVRNFMANARAGTVGTKTRGNVSGSGKKLWKQKGTGRARIASIRSPLWKGGGNVHGPQPRDWSYNLPKKMRRGALRSALSERLREGNLVVIDEFTLDQPKTKEFIKTLTALELEGKTLIVESVDNDNLLLAARNVKRAKIVSSHSLNIYDLLYHEKLVLSRAAAGELAELLGPKSKRNEATEESDSSEDAEPEGGNAVDEEAEEAA